MTEHEQQQQAAGAGGGARRGATSMKQPTTVHPTPIFSYYLPKLYYYRIKPPQTRLPLPIPSLPWELGAMGLTLTLRTVHLHAHAAPPQVR